MLSRLSIPPPLLLPEQSQRYQQKKIFNSVEASKFDENNKNGNNKRLKPSTVISHHAREPIPPPPPLLQINASSENSEESESYEHSLRTSASPSSTTLSSISGRGFSEEEEEEEETYEDEDEQVDNNRENNQVNPCTLEQTQLPSHAPPHSHNTLKVTEHIPIINDSNTNENTQSSLPVASSPYTNTVNSENKETISRTIEHKQSIASPSPELPLNSSTETTHLREKTSLSSSSSSSLVLRPEKQEMEQKQKQWKMTSISSSIPLSQSLTNTRETSLKAQKWKNNDDNSLHEQQIQHQTIHNENLHEVSSEPTIHVQRKSSLQEVNEQKQENKLITHEEEREQPNTDKTNSNNKEESPSMYNSNTEFTSSAPVQSSLVKSSSFAPEITPYLLTHLSNDELNSIIKEQGERIRTLVLERSNTQLLIAEQQRVIHTLTHNSEKFTNNLETREQECTSLRSKLKAVQSECAALKDKTKLQEAEIVQFNNTWTQRSQHMKRELQALIDERNSLQAQRDEVLDNHRTLRMETEKMESQVAQMKHSTTREKEMYKKELEEQMQCRLRDKEEILAVREDEIRREKTNLEKMLRNVSDENNHLRSMNEFSHDDVSQLNKLLQKKETALQTYKNKLTQLWNELREREETMEKERNSVSQKIQSILSSHQAELSHVQSQLKSSQNEVDSLHLQISSLQDRHQHEQNKIQHEQRLHYEREDYKEREWHRKLEEWKNKWVEASEAHSQSISIINTLQREKENMNNEVQRLSLLLREVRLELQQKKEHYIVAENKIDLLLRKLSEKDKLIETYRIQAERELWEQTLDDHDNDNIICNIINKKKSIGWKSDSKDRKQKKIMIINKDKNNNDDDNDDDHDEDKIEEDERLVIKNNACRTHNSEEEEHESITHEYNAKSKRTSKLNENHRIINNNKSETVLHQSREHPVNEERNKTMNKTSNTEEKKEFEPEQSLPRVVEQEITKYEKEHGVQNKPIEQHYTTIHNKTNIPSDTHHKYSSLPRQSWSYSRRGISPISIITSNSLPLQPEPHSAWHELLQKGNKRSSHSLHEYNICDEPNEVDNHTDILTANREQSHCVHSYNHLGVNSVGVHNIKGNNNEKELEQLDGNSIKKNDTDINKVNCSEQFNLGCTDNGRVHYTHYNTIKHNNNSSNNNYNEVYFDDSVFLPSPLATSSSSEFLFNVRNKLQQLRPPFAIPSLSPSPLSPLESGTTKNNKKQSIHSASSSSPPVLHSDWHTAVNNHHQENEENNCKTVNMNKHFKCEEEQIKVENVGDEIAVVVDGTHSNDNIYSSSGIALSSPLSPPPSLSPSAPIQVIEPLREPDLEIFGNKNNDKETNTELYPLSLIQQIVQQTMEQYHTNRRESNTPLTQESECEQHYKSLPPEQTAQKFTCECYNESNQTESNHEVHGNTKEYTQALIEVQFTPEQGTSFKEINNLNYLDHENDTNSAERECYATNINNNSNSNSSRRVITKLQEKEKVAADGTKEHKIIVSPRHAHHRREAVKQFSTLEQEEEEQEEYSLEPLSELSEIPENNSNDSLKTDECSRSSNRSNTKNKINDISKSMITENKTFFHDQYSLANLTWSDEIRMLASPPRTSHTFDKTRTNALNAIEAQFIDQSSIESMENEYNETEKLDTEKKPIET